MHHHGVRSPVTSPKSAQPRRQSAPLAGPSPRKNHKKEAIPPGWPSRPERWGNNHTHILMQDMCNFADCVPMSAFTRKMTVFRRTGIKKATLRWLKKMTELHRAKHSAGTSCFPSPSKEYINRANLAELPSFPIPSWANHDSTGP